MLLAHTFSLSLSAYFRIQFSIISMTRKKNLATATATACSRNQCELQKQMGTGETSQTN